MGNKVTFEQLSEIQGEIQFLALACRGANQLLEEKSAAERRETNPVPEGELATAPDIFYSVAERLDAIAAKIGVVCYE